MAAKYMQEQEFRGRLEKTDKSHSPSRDRARESALKSSRFVHVNSNSGRGERGTDKRAKNNDYAVE